MKMTIDKSKIEKVFYKVLELVFTGVILAVVASLLTTTIIENAEKERKIDSQIDTISSIYIGCNKSWIDEKLGYAQFSSQKGDYLLCAYTSEFFVVQVAFDDALSAQAYLITSLENDSKISININDTTLRDNSTLRLGEFSYYDFPNAPMSILGFVSNGNARALYSESYYFISFGNYYEYHIASFDFGKLNGTVEDFLHEFEMPKGDIDDEVSVDKNRGVQVITDRQNNYPNTYGVSNLGADIEDLLFTYDWFNSQQLRNKLNDTGQ